MFVQKRFKNNSFLTIVLLIKIISFSILCIYSLIYSFQQNNDFLSRLLPLVDFIENPKIPTFLQNLEKCTQNICPLEKEFHCDWTDVNICTVLVYMLNLNSCSSKCIDKSEFKSYNNLVACYFYWFDCPTFCVSSVW